MREFGERLPNETIEQLTDPLHIYGEKRPKKQDPLSKFWEKKTIRTSKKLFGQLEAFMGVELSPEIIELQMRIDRLSPRVRGYMAREVALENRTLSEEVREGLKAEQKALKKDMINQEKAELLTHQDWLTKRK